MRMADRKGGSHKGRDEKDAIDHDEQLLDEPVLEELYAWVDSIPLSRPKKNIARDFSDGVLVAELIKFHFDKLVDMHNYSGANGAGGKRENWNVLNRKVFSKLNFELTEELISDLTCCKPGVIEKLLMLLKSKIDRAVYARERKDRPEAEQHEVSPGRKGGNMKVAIDGTKNSKFIKTKQTQPPSVKGQPQNPQPLPKKRVGNMAESDLVARYVVEEKEQEILSRDETIQILQAKITRLEHLLHLKDIRIEDLQNRVEATRPTGVRNDVQIRQQVQRK